MTEAVVDASVCGNLLFPEQHSDRAIALFDDAGRNLISLVAPYLLLVEVTNSIRRHMRRERLSLSYAMTLLDSFLNQPVDLLEDRDLHRQALALTERFSLGAYDAHYVALAGTVGCDLWTADQRIMRALGGQLAFARWIGDYALMEDQSSPGLGG